VTDGCRLGQNFDQRCRFAVNARSILIASLGLNLVLGCWAVARWQGRPAPDGSSHRGPDSLAAPEAKSLPVWRTQRTNVFEFVTNRLDAPGFQWSQIEANDYEAYAANLRGVGCPEHVVRQMLLAEIEAHYADRHADTEKYSNFWETESQRDARQADILREHRKFDIEKRALIARILGITWSAKAFKEYVKEEELAILVGCLSDDSALRLMDAAMRIEEEIKMFQAETRGIVIDTDEPRLEALLTEFRRNMEQAVTPAEAEEMLLRLSDLANGFIFGNRLAGVSLTGDELRRIAAITARVRDLVGVVLRNELDKHRPGGDVEDVLDKLPPESLPGIRQLLGPERAAAFERSMDKDFRDFARAARRTELPVDSAVKAFAIRRDAEAAAGELKAIEGLDAAQRNASLEALRRETELAMRQVVGEKGMKEFFRTDRGWVNAAFTMKGPKG
jgi:hypothetical protein